MSQAIVRGAAAPRARGIEVGRKLGWNESTLPGEIRADMREVARRKGAPTPDEAPALVIGPRHSSTSDVLRLPRGRRRIVEGKGQGNGDGRA
ncbi:MAG TPA: hypothetical protein VGI39_34265 [Polyangiaceae bacterium]